MICDCNTKSQKSNEDVNIDQNSTGHPLKKREITSQTEKECEGDCLLTAKSSEKNDEIITIKENCNVKKSDLLEYCPTADDFFEINREKPKDCILQNTTDNESFQYHCIKFKLFISLQIINIGEGPKDNFKFISLDTRLDLITECQINENGEAKILKEFKLPKEMTSGRLVEYNGNIYSRHGLRSERRIVKYNIETKKLTFGNKLGFVEYNDENVCVVPDDNFFWVFDVINKTENLKRGRIERVVVGYKMDLDNLKVLSKQNFTFINCKINSIFVAYGKFYYLRKHPPNKFRILSALHNKVIADIDLPEIPRPYATSSNFFYNITEQNLYLYYTNVVDNHVLYVKKLQFNCSNED
ncbi:uncharacterized protein LOC111642334 [Centruroides sculpturatus]|uniref:uncharacterized protein LOC111642334 n=1 Tax=Centruroides sculpturatus TaxID=218467 RepID=UPI000C6DC0C2|nr:uncharacterized protein LOC111642334 [Centruroides sculpturatus]